ncbi:ATP synthase F0 subunit A [candidate division KSB1 bacterium]|nr:F0F1 ATP synthase subunit A [candidate division KSB1 bacterium]RQW02566.1 MAG: ATP synthase F0 subunit A [candidate division KSB1 bacterium]
MFLEDTINHLSEHPEMTQHAAEHGAGGSEHIMDHILAHKVISLPTVAGIDLSITNHVIMMFIASALLILAFGLAFRKRQLVPTGWANALESLVEYIWRDVILANLGRDARAYAPYLLTAFFFILLCNLLGLVPYGATATGNIGTTAAMAILTLIVGLYAGMRKFGVVKSLKHLIPSGLPVFIIPIMIPVEIVSLIAKHVALAIRLFANMIAGHITTLAIMSLIFIFKNWLFVPFPLVLIIFVSLLEILIAFIQAYVFTTLSSVFISASVSEEH